MAISLTGSGIPCQSITATHTSTTTSDTTVPWGGVVGRTYTDNFSSSLPIGVICKVTINRVTYSGSGASSYYYNFKSSLSGTNLLLNNNSTTASRYSDGSHSDVSVLSSSSFTIGSQVISGSYDGWGNTITKYYLRLE